MRIVILRHSESLDDVEDRYGGFANYPLTQNGINTVNNSKHKLPTNIGKIFTSPYLRAYETAEIVGKHLSIIPEVKQAIRERNTYGFLSGMRKPKAKKLFPVECQKVTDTHTADEVDGTEKYNEVVERLKTFYSEIQKLTDQTILLVAHGKVIDIFLTEILKCTKKYKFHDCSFLVFNTKTHNVEKLDNVDIK